MSAQANKESAEAAYRAFSAGDAAAAMEKMDDGVVWTARGHSSISGTYKGKEEVASLWVKLGEKGLRTEPHDFIADSDKSSSSPPSLSTARATRPPTFSPTTRRAS